MKWNWGTGLTLGMICFIGFILYFVITMSTDKKYSHDLVTESYYAKEMMYQTEIDAETNTTLLSERLVSKKVANGWLDYAMVSATTGRPQPIPEDIIKIYSV